MSESPCFPSNIDRHSSAEPGIELGAEFQARSGFFFEVGVVLWIEPKVPAKAFVRRTREHVQRKER